MICPTDQGAYRTGRKSIFYKIAKRREKTWRSGVARPISGAGARVSLSRNTPSTYRLLYDVWTPPYRGPHIPCLERGRMHVQLAPWVVFSLATAMSDLKKDVCWVGD